MQKGEKKAGTLRAGMENLSEKGRDYIKHITEIMLLYQNSPISPDTAGQPDVPKNPPDAGEMKDTEALSKLQF